MVKQIISFMTFIVIALTAITVVTHSAEAASSDTARAILEAADVHGGLVVHLNCGDGTLTAALHTGDAYLVHGLTRDAEELQKARQTITARSTYGSVSADLLTGDTLPYIDNSVNLLVANGPVDVAVDEVIRVLVPRGVAILMNASVDVGNTAGEKVQLNGTPCVKIVKPWSDTRDEWTHYLHDPSNNAVAHDTAIGPLRHLQWDGAPKYSRHHEFMSSVTAMVSAHGRLFSIIDMGSRASIHMPSKWRLTARDAFNGIVLWERDLPSWFNHLWPLKDGPAQPPRRLVAVGDSVYVTLGLDAPVSRLDAATGKILQTYAGTEFTEEILCSNGTLFLVKNDSSMNPKDYHPKLMVCWDEKNRTMKKEEGLLLTAQPRHIIALDPITGTVVWQATQPIEPLTLAADEENVYFHNWKSVACLDRKTGKKRWISKPVAPREDMGYVYGPTLVSYDKVVLFADGRQQRKIFGVSKADGKVLWQAPHYAAGHAGSPEDLMVVDGLVWCGKIAGGNNSGVFTGVDPLTGEVKREFTPDVKTYWFHHRCYRAKATDNYILTSRTGIEFVDVRKKTWETHHWVRGACTYGIVPCNGLVYAPPHPCACYLESKLNGVSALAPASQRTVHQRVPTAARLMKGPAYGESLQPIDLKSTDWPVYRHDSSRSGATTASVKLPVSQQWQTELGSHLTAPVAAGGRVYVASRDAHAVYALDAQNGAVTWTFTAGGPIDSPPTVYRGLILFGSADGRVYCLRASDGVLVWRFTAAPEEMRLVSYGRLESVWPVHGSVLVRDGIVYCIAGRSTFLDGGLHFYRLDVTTGRMLSQKTFYDQTSPQQDVKVLNMPTALTDILTSDGQNIYMRSQVLDFDGNRIQTIDPSLDPLERATEQLGTGSHVFSATGFLDDQAWHRSYWLYGRSFSYGCNWWFRAGRYAPAGRLLVFDDDHVYGFGREPGLFVWSHVLENHIFRAAKQADADAIDHVKAWSNKSGRNAVFNREFTRAASASDRLAPGLDWSVTHPPLHARAVVLADQALFLAGPPDVLDEDAAFNSPFAQEIEAEIAEQDAAYEGQRGGILMAVSTNDGQSLLQEQLASPPVWDGMAAAGGQLYMATVDGKVVCLGQRQ